MQVIALIEDVHVVQRILEIFPNLAPRCCSEPDPMGAFWFTVFNEFERKA
jgi:hypothetical protein